MDRIILQRKPIRQSFTVTYKTLQDLIKEDKPDFNKIEVSFAKLERLGNQLDPLDSSLIDLILDLKDESRLEKEYEEQDEYRDKLIQARVDVESLKSSWSARSQSARSSPTISRKKLKLPELQLKQFSGEIKDWLSFWSQFKRIHEDRDIEVEDKFQYLIQTMVKNSKARDIVESFPPTAQNYQKAIDVLKNRYGRDELLIEHYVRELISLVIKNTTTPKSQIKLSTLYDRLESHLRALESIGMTRDKYEAMLFPLVESCIPEDILRAWLRCPSSKYQSDEEADNGSYQNRLQQLLLFIKGEVESEERIMLARVGLGIKNHRSDENNSKSKTSLGDNNEFVPTACNLHAAEKQQKCDRPYSYQKQFNQESNKGIFNTVCVFCDKHHDSKDCFNAQKMSLAQKNELLGKKRACFSCLKIGHRSKDCKSNVRCILCSNKHQTIVCPCLKNNNIENKSRTTKGHTDEKDERKSPGEPDGKVSNSLTSQNNRSTETAQVFLQTMMVKLCNKNKNKVVRVLLDSGSQKSYIKKSTAEEMEYGPIGEEEIVHALFGGVKSSKTKHKRYEIKLFDLSGSLSCDISLLDQSVICSPLPRLQYGPWCEELERKNISFTDLGSDQPEIEILIGADIWSKILTGKTEKLDCGLLALETHFGWTIMGSLVKENESYELNRLSTLVTSMFVHTENLPEIWNLDVLGIRDPYEKKSKEELELAARRHFEETLSINKEGRYEILLPWIEVRDKLESNKDIAEKRLLTTTEKLNTLGKFNVYDSVFVEWEKQGIIEEVKETESLNEGYFLPHRPVIKEESTTKVRPVFDASNRKKGSFSLNDCLEKGPNVIELIPEVLLRFREKEIGVISDIEKAFLQIAVNKTDRNYLKFLWWKNYDKKQTKVYKHCRVVFGVNCSPFMLGAVINHHLKNCPPEYQETAMKLRKSFYVDNCVTSVESDSELREFIEKSTALMGSAKFNLRDWQFTKDFESKINNKPCKVLGMQWDRMEDTIYCDLRNIDKPEVVTRRTILSMVHKVFDPIGFTSPFTLLPKILLQESWKSKVDWDAEVPEDVKNKFLKWCKELVNLVNVRLPRCIGLKINQLENTSIHVFCDSSKLAFATVIFLRTEKNGVVELHLLMAKSRVSPLKAMTIPRLELMSCLIGARLMETINNGLSDSLKNVKIYYWTDSSTALFWIMKEEPWGVFVQNRVQEIREKTGKNWKHVPGELNPADLPSRGCNINRLVESKWWEGPAWLKQPEDAWPKSNFTCINSDEINEERREKVEVLTNAKKEDQEWYLHYFSDYIKIVRMFAWLLRFTTNIRKTVNERVVGELLVSEIQKAEKLLLKQVQKESFDKNNLAELKLLSYFEDSDGLLRVKTKLTNRSGECNSYKYPIVLPHNHRLVQLMIKHEHVHMSHAGLNILLTKLRERFWILKGRKAVRTCINKCIICRRHTVNNIQPEPSSLPADRVEDAQVFKTVGIDLAGPLIMRDGAKVWITIYTCAVYRAVHFELISSLSTNGFILGLRRFIARRGRPKTIYSDNGSNFVGTNNLFKNIDWTYIEKQCTSIWKIQWKFNPPTASWWGGWWERIVQMVKGILRRVLKNASVNYEEMNSILCDTEAVINSRPLTYLSDEMDDMIPLTPAMFLQEISTVDVADLDLIDTNNISRRYRYQQKLREDLRKRFRNEYLSSLVVHGKKPKSIINLKEGDVVLIGSDGKKRMEWPLGKIVKLYPGNDAIVRVARVKTNFGELIRPIQRLYPMEISAQDSQSKEVQRGNRIEEEEKIVEKQSIKQPGHYEEENSVMKSRSGRAIKFPPKFFDFEL